jgi:hypothetical protein
MRETATCLLRRAIAAVALATMSAALSAADTPRVIHGYPPPTALVGEPIAVETGLLQVELLPGVVVSATAGAVLVLTPAREGSDAFAVTVVSGPVWAVHLPRDEMRFLGVGIHLVGSGLQNKARDPETSTTETWIAPLETMPGYEAATNKLVLGDGIMVRQQQYLDKLKVDVTGINRLVVSIIRGMLPRP